MSDELTPHDELRIHELYARYNWAADAGDGDAWARCFAEDATFASSGDPDKPLRGRAAFAAFISSPERMGAKARHWTNNLLLTRRGEIVQGKCYTLLVGLTGKRPEVLLSVSYQDEIVRRDGAWLFLSRRPQRDVAPA